MHLVSLVQCALVQFIFQELRCTEGHWLLSEGQLEIKTADGTDTGGGGMGGNRNEMVGLNNLPEVCLANVLSFTSPQDACRLSSVSSIFKSAAESDVVWERFLPPDYQTMIPESSVAQFFSSFSNTKKKELYRILCQNPVLLDEGKMIFSLNKVNGKKQYMLSARFLHIVWGQRDDYWEWKDDLSIRFIEVAELRSVRWLEIRGSLNTRLLSPTTLYAAYFVFKLTGRSFGFKYQPVEVRVRFVGGTSVKRIVCLDYDRANRSGTHVKASNIDVQYPKRRGDGWYEVELGEFFVQRGVREEEVEMGVYEVEDIHWKSGLVVEGFEIRPKIKLDEIVSNNNLIGCRMEDMKQELASLEKSTAETLKRNNWSTAMSIVATIFAAGLAGFVDGYYLRNAMVEDTKKQHALLENYVAKLESFERKKKLLECDVLCMYHFRCRTCRFSCYFWNVMCSASTIFVVGLAGFVARGR